MDYGLIQQELRIGTRFAMRNEVFEVAFTDNTVIRYSSVNGGRPKSIPTLSFWQLEAEGVIGFVGEALPAGTSQQVIGLHQLSNAQRDEMLRRKRYVDAVLFCRRQPLAKKNICQAIKYVRDELNDPRPPGISTLARWVHEYRISNYNIRVLVPRHDRKGPQFTRLPLEVELIVGSNLCSYVDDRSLSGEDLRCHVVAHIKRFGLLSTSRKPPSKSTIYRRIKSLDPYLVALKRYGKHRADREHLAAGVGIETTRPMEVVMIDGHIMDVIVIDPSTGEPLGRPYLVCLFDVNTRCVVGWYISLMPFCATTALAALKHACTRNPAAGPGGIPECILPDLGRDLISHAMRNFCKALGIHLAPAKAYCPDDKAHLERFFRTLNMMLVHKLAGTTFSNPEDRDEYDSNAMAKYTLTQVQELFEKWLTTVYEIHVHSGIGRAPRLEWRDKQIQWPITMLSVEEADVLARVAHSRTISNGRVVVDYLSYKSNALSMLEAKGMRSVTVLVNELDLSHVYITHESDPQLLIRADSTKRKYTQELTQYEHDEVKKQLKVTTLRDLAEIGEYAYEIARWEMWESIHKINTSRAGKRLKALRQKASEKIESSKRKATRLSEYQIPEPRTDVAEGETGTGNDHEGHTAGKKSDSMVANSPTVFDCIDI